MESTNPYKAGAGRLRESGARKILELRGQTNEATGERYTYREIAALLDVSQGTVYNVCKGRTWGWLSA